jgi:lipid-binding SYLF domain-containing protein
MHEASLHEEVTATLNRLRTRHRDLAGVLDKAYGFAVFPSVGRAAAVVGVAAGDGEVFEQCKPTGFASLHQITVGVQIGGQTFGEVLVFETKEALDHFKAGGLSFTANVSATLLKAAASATTGFRGVDVLAFGEGGELLEGSLGVQKFDFHPPGALDAKARRDAKARGEKRPAGDKVVSAAAKLASTLAHLGTGEGGAKSESGEEPGAPSFAASLGKLAGLVMNVREGLEREAGEGLHDEVRAAVHRREREDPGLRERLDRAWAFAVFPAVGRASAVLGATYGLGEVFRGRGLIGYSGLLQLTVGVQLGGQTFTEFVLFEDEAAFSRFASGKLAFTSSAAAVAVRSGAATTHAGEGTEVLVFSKGGFHVEAAIGGQRFVYTPATLTAGASLDRAEAPREKEHEPG